MSFFKNTGGLPGAAHRLPRPEPLPEAKFKPLEEVPFPTKHGTPLPCKRPGCDRPRAWLSNGLCDVHAAERKARSARDKARPMCACGRDRCHTSRGDGTKCSLCWRDEEARRERYSKRDLMLWQLDQCETVEELRTWIRQHLLEDEE